MLSAWRQQDLPRQNQIVVFGFLHAEADEILKTVTPDVISLDIHMPVEDGVSFLGRLMKQKFIPVVLVTSLNLDDSDKVFEALSLGAIEYIKKPDYNDMEDAGDMICEKFKVASCIRQKGQAPMQRFMLWRCPAKGCISAAIS